MGDVMGNDAAQDFLIRAKAIADAVQRAGQPLRARATACYVVAAICGAYRRLAEPAP